MFMRHALQLRNLLCSYPQHVVFLIISNFASHLPSLIGYTNFQLLRDNFVDRRSCGVDGG